MKKLVNRRGQLLVENIVFILLNLIFLSILILFIFRQGGGAVLLEQSYAKEVALLIDAATPIMTMKLDMQDGFDVAEKNGISKEDILKIKDNRVIVKLNKDGSYEYSFFNDVEATVYPDVLDGYYIIKINGYKNE